MVIGFVLSLLLVCSPAAIAWFVIAVSIRKAINSQAVRTWTHVSKEVLKRFFPPFTNSYTSASVMLETYGLFVEASDKNSSISTVFPRSASSMRCFYLDSILFLQATATLGKSVAKADAALAAFFPAIANAVPVEFLCLSGSDMMRKGYHVQTTKFLSGKVDDSWHGFLVKKHCKSRLRNHRNIL